MRSLDQPGVAPRRAPLDLDAAIVDLVSRGAVKVPPYPAVAMKVEQLVRRQDFGLDELTKLVASDQALAADALRCANAAFYSRGAPVTALNGAISRIGSKEVVRLALASGLGVHARRAGPLAVLKRRVWLEALSSAALAQELARKRGLAPEEAFVCGLLHDFGKMIVISCVEEILEARRGERGRSLEGWMETVERYHVELGLVLAARWQLPQIVSDVVSLHHQEEPTGAADPRLLEVVAAADEVVGLLRDHCWLTPQELGVVAALSGQECELVARVLDRLPSFIASFEGGASAPSPDPGLVEPKGRDQFAAGPKSVGFPVTVTFSREVRRYKAKSIGMSNLTVNGVTPLPENVLMEVSLGSTPPLTCWATAKLSWPEESGHTVLVQPFALNGASQEIWKALARQVPAK